MKGLEDSCSAEEVATALAVVGMCRPGDIKTGRMTNLPNGMNVMWISCPIAAAKRIAEEGKVRID